ncbi:MAG: NADH:ubiquinone reductase (Na(+)-transporting) subunit C [Flavobacteriaceae bacterium]|nr:NADH:ubiquinone reductase (Na(+)-transporting) subunit C [Flavobacteriaceae bacterium]
MDRDSNIYTFLFSAIMVIIVAATLATSATSLEEIQNENVRKEKMQNILSTIGIEVEREKAPEIYNNYIVEELALVSDGSIDKDIDAFTLKLNLEIKKPIKEQRFPLYLAQVDSLKYYIVPLRGSGLWDAIWGYIALEADKNTIKGAVFDHKAETAGLGAEITQKWFLDRFVGEKIFNDNDELVGISVSKTNNDPNGMDKDDNEVDAISGATITGDGVTNMIKERLQNYLSYFNNKNEIIAYQN